MTRSRFHTDGFGEVGEWFAEPLLILQSTWIPDYIELEGNRLYWSMNSDEDQNGVKRPRDPSDVAKGDNPVLEARSRGMWYMCGNLTKTPHQESTKKMLDAFIRINDGNDVLSFARRYGILELCEHDNPLKYGTEMLCESTDWWVCHPNGYPGLCWESVDAWMWYVRKAVAILQISTALNKNIQTKRLDWANLLLKDPGKYPDFGQAFVTQGSPELNLSLHLRGWLNQADIRPAFYWTENGPTIGLSGGSAYGVLSVQLWLAIAKSQDMTMCSGCAELYLRTRKVQRGRKNFCPECHEKGIPARDRKRAQRAAKAMEQSGDFGD